MTEKKEITLPIKCSTAKCLYKVLSEIVLVIGVLLPFIGAAMCAASWYIFTYIDPISTSYSSYGPVLHINDNGMFLMGVGFFCLMIGIASCSMILSERYNFSCIKDE